MTDANTAIVEREIMPVVQRAREITVVSAEQYAGAADFLKAVKSAQKTVSEHFGPMKNAAHAAWKKITETEAAALKPLTEAEQHVKRLMLEYRAAQERIQAAAQARLQAEADARAEAERRKLEKEAAKLKTPELREQRLEQAAAVVAPVVQVKVEVPEVKGQAVRKIWRARITDSKKAVEAVLAWPDWAAYVTLNEREFDRLAARTKGAVQIAGLEMYEETSLSSRAL